MNEEYFQDWIKNGQKEYLCCFGVLSGGPGYFGFDHCRHEEHPDVRYGRERCPTNCPHFEQHHSLILRQIYKSINS